MRGKICLVTGANRGIGREVARSLAGSHATVVLVCRDSNRGTVAAEAIAAETGNNDIDLLTADLSSMQQVRTLAADFKKRYDRLDVLINNAAVVTRKRAETVDGNEMQFAVNYLAPFLLTHLLLDRLVIAGEARIINVASRAHWRSGNRFDDLHQPGRYSRWKAYAQSKLGNLMFTYELARRLSGSDVTVNAVHPGLIYTGLARDLADLPDWLGWLQRSISGGTSSGARTIVFLATSEQVHGVSGRYFVNCRPRRTSPWSYDRRAQRHLWQMSEELVGLAHRSVPPVSP